MKFDTIIIGGGLSALTAGIRLQKGRQHVAVIGTGQSTLHFSSGSFDLLGYDSDGKEVTNPLEAMKTLPEDHPYHKLSNVEELANDAKALLNEAGIIVSGDNTYNHHRLSPIGKTAPTWLTLNGLLNIDTDKLQGKDVIIANVEGFLDFHTDFLRDALEKMGANVTVCQFTTPELENARRSPSEFRATTIGNYLNNEEAAKNVALELNKMPKADCILLPAILGISGDIADTIVRQAVKTPIHCVATMHPSLCGKRIADQLRRNFIALGGEHFLSDTVEHGDIKDNHVTAVYTHNMVEEPLEANNYILASGSFMSRGLSSNYQEVWEPVFHVDVDASANRAEWHDPKFFNSQAFLSYGVRTDDKLHAMKNGKVIDNLYAIGSILSGNNFIHYADHEGVDMLTALSVAHSISL